MEKIKEFIKEKKLILPGEVIGVGVSGGSDSMALLHYLNGIKEELDFENKELTIEEKVKIRKLYTLLTYYKSNQKNTYACCSLITTISKTRIFKPINEYDFIGKERCSNEVMNQIDKELIEKFTKNI